VTQATECSEKPVTAANTAATARILYVHGRSTCHGGSPTSLLDIVTHLDRDRFEPLVLCPAAGELSERLGEVEVPVVTRQFVELKRETALQFGLDVAWYHRWLRRESIALVHVNTLDWRPSVVLAARLRGIPCVQHVRNLPHQERRNFSFRWANRIITVSDDVGRPFREDPLFRDKTRTIYNPVDLSCYEDHEDRRPDIAADGRPVIGFVGQLKAGKGVHTLIEALSRVLERHPTALLVIVGCDPSETGDYERECRRLAEERRIEPQVIFTGFRRDVPAWMRTFDVFVLPTRYETFGKVVIEAMAAGCPVVASAVGGIPEILCRPELGTLIPPDDPEATAQAIIRYLQEPELARKVGDAGREHVRKHFSLDAMMRKLESLYDELLAGSRPTQV